LKRPTVNHPTVILNCKRASAYAAALFCVAGTLSSAPVIAGPELGAAVVTEYDSNILPEAGITTQNQGDWATGTSAYLGWESKIKRGFEWQGRYEYSATRWQQAAEFDTDLQTGYLRLGYNRGAHTTDLVALMASADLQGQPFMTLRRLSPAYGYFLTSQWYVRAQVDIGDKTFEIYPERDANQLGARANVFWLLNRTSHYVSLRGVFRNENTRSEPYGYQSFNSRLRWKYRVGDLSLMAQGAWEVRSYEAVWTDIGERRRDNRIRVSTGLEYPLWWGMTLEAEAGRDMYQSNLPAADYQQYRFKLGLNWDY
jgi:hypothetical protein|tara:strand:- start:1963 stop:2898 length:936 start_codon:yes stop_codon:yes gene_type:complete